MGQFKAYCQKMGLMGELVVPPLSGERRVPFFLPWLQRSFCGGQPIGHLGAPEKAEEGSWGAAGNCS